MKLRYITFTGADDYTKPGDLMSIVRRHPRISIEWGILVSKNSEGTARFPSFKWTERFAETIRANPDVNMNASMHLCGSWLRDLLAGVVSPSVDELLDLGIFQRMQLNFHGQRQKVDPDLFITALRHVSSRLIGKWAPEVIFQWEGVNQSLIDMASKESVPMSALFDLSHGAGVLPSSWPLPLPGIKCGYAGGLGPDNLDKMMSLIDQAVDGSETWIDMETRVRSLDDKLFDLLKVEKCVGIAEDYLHRS